MGGTQCNGHSSLYFKRLIGIKVPALVGDYLWSWLLCYTHDEAAHAVFFDLKELQACNW